MRGLNRSILAGRLVADPEIRYTQKETAVTHFRLAINWQNKNGKGVDFINCVAWGSLAKICGEYLKKGRLVAVEGRLQVKSYQDKKGQNRTTTEVVVDNMQMLDSKFFNAANKAEGSQEEELIEV
ncbi:MAG: single-stranded DNA-binding protein [Candidatus Saganbacteria bacterium]|nr:single-stranded DNA-binding protein [Candidatus Saganbacteria bacterium]